MTKGSKGTGMTTHEMLLEILEILRRIDARDSLSPMEKANIEAQMNTGKWRLNEQF